MSHISAATAKALGGLAPEAPNNLSNVARCYARRVPPVTNRNRRVRYENRFL